MKEFLDTAIEAARKAGEIQLSGLGKEKNVRYKGEINLVTEIDKKSETVIIQHILSKYPDHNILAEESHPDKRSGEFLWIIDPIDGTTNYAHEFPFFCVSIALSIDKEITVGVIYDALRDELFYSTKNGGAFYNNERIHVSRTTELRQSLIGTGFPYEITIESKEFFSHFLMKAQAIRRAGSAALDLAYLANGRLDGFWELCLHPWDTAAGIVLVEEAGGMVTDFNGGDYSIFRKEILATNGKIHSQMIKELQTVRKLLSFKNTQESEAQVSPT